MADLAGITAVRPTSNTRTAIVTYGETVGVGTPLYLDQNDNEYKLADSNNTVSTAQASAIAMTPGVDGGQGLVAVGGSVILVGTTMVQGQMYVVSATAGGVAPNTDLASGWYVTDLGRAASTTQLDLDINATGITF